MKRRVLSLLLALAMVLSLVPSVGFAEEADQGEAGTGEPAVQSYAGEGARLDGAEVVKGKTSGVYVRTKYQISAMSFVSGGTYRFVAAAYDDDGKLLNSGYAEQRLYDTDGEQVILFEGDVPEYCGVCVFLLDRDNVYLDSRYAEWTEIARSGEQGDLKWEFEPQYGTLTVTGDGRALMEPNQITPSGYSWSYFADEVKELVLDNVVNISDGAFADFPNLEEVEVRSTVSETFPIGAHAFENCSSLKTVKLFPTDLGEYAFAGCESLEQLTLCEGLEVIPTGAFADIGTLQELHVPSTLKAIEDDAFANTKIEIIWYARDFDWSAVEIGTGNEGLLAVLPITEGNEALDASEATEATEPTEETEPTETAAPTAGEETEEEAALEGYYIAPDGAQLLEEPVLENMAAFTGKATAKSGVYTASFTGLVPYLYYTLIVSRSPGSLDSEDLRYIGMGMADETGKLTCRYIPKDNEKAIVQLYGYDPLEVWPNRDYFTLRPGESVDFCFLSTAWQKAHIRIWCENSPEELTLTQWEGTDSDWTLTAREDLNLQNPEIRYVNFIAEAMGQQVTMKLRVDLVPDTTTAKGVSLVNTAVTRNLYDADDTEIPIFLELETPEQPATDVQALNAEETKDEPGLIESVRFSDDTDGMVKTFFDIRVQDDHTLLLSSSDHNLLEKADWLGSLKNSYNVAFTVRVGDQELTTEALKLTIQRKKPVLKAQAVTLNGWYLLPSEEIQFTGGTVTRFLEADVGSLPVELGQGGTASQEYTGTDVYLTSPVRKDLSGNVKASVMVEGCNVPISVTIPVKIVCKAPAFKLGKSSVTFNPTGYNLVTVPLSCGTKGLDLSQMDLTYAELRDSAGETSLEGYETEVNDNLTELSIRTTGQTRPIGTKNVTLALGFTTGGVFEIGGKELNLKLKLTVKEPKLKLSTSTVTFNTVTYTAEGDTPVSDKARVTFTSDLSLGYTSEGLEYTILNKAKQDCTDLFTVNLWYIEDSGYIDIIPDLARVDPKDTYTLTLGVPGGKSPAKLTLKFSSAAPSVTMKAQGKLDSFEPTDKACVMLTFSFKNMGNGFEYLWDTMEEGPELALYDSKGKELDYDLWGWQLWRGSNSAILYPDDGIIPAGKYKAVLTFGYWNSKPVTATTTITAVQTPTTVKLSKSSLTLHPQGSSLELTATPSRVPSKDFNWEWPEVRLDYYKADGKTLWQDQDLIAAGLDLENGKLEVVPTGNVPEKDTTVKVKIYPDARAENKFLWLTVKVLGSKAVNTPQKITPKVSGTLDPAKEWNFLVLTGSPKGCDNIKDINDGFMFGLERSQDKGKTWKKVDLPSSCYMRGGQFSLALYNIGNELDPGCKYRVRIDWCIGNDTLVASITAAVKCAYGPNKFTVENAPTLYKKDPWADLDFRLKAKDAGQVIDHIRVKGNPAFEVDGSGENWTLRYVGNDPDTLKTTTLTLEIFLRGTNGTKPNFTAPLKLSVK